MKSMDTQRLILFFVFSFSLLLLWTEWEKEQRPKPAAVAATAAQPGGAKIVPGVVPTPATTAASPPAPAAQAPAPAAVPAKGEIVQIRTDLLVADIDTQGGGLVRLELLKHKETNDQSKNLELLGPEHQYFAQSGLTGDGGPNHRTLCP